MPRRTNGVRGGSSKRSDMTSDEAKDGDNRSPQSLDLIHSNVEGFRNPTAALASSSDALQRLADIAHFFRSSFTHDVNMVEGEFRIEMDRENKIQGLHETVDILTHVENKRMANLRQEVEELKASQEDCERERESCQKMEAELEARHANKEAEREAEYNQKCLDEELKFEESLKVKNAELEAESKQKVEELERQTAKLSVSNEHLKQQLVKAQKKLETKKMRHARVRGSLEEENKKLATELKQVKADFPVEKQPVEYYMKQFQGISHAIRVISSKYFQKLPERAVEDPEAVNLELSRLDPIFDSTPIWQSESSEFLRLRNIQHIISGCLCDFIWRPFFPRDSPTKNEAVIPFLEEVSKSLSQSGGRSESVWRALCLRGIEDLSAESNRADSVLHLVLETVRPLTIAADLAEFKQDLANIVKDSITLWKTAQQDEAKIVFDKRPDPSNERTWQAEDIRDWADASTKPDAKIDTGGIPPLCIFPNILRVDVSGEVVVVHQGSALFPTSQVRVQALLEKKQHEEELAEAVSIARSKVHARRISCPSGPTSPVVQKFPVFQS